MAEYGIVVGVKDIKGNCQLEGFTDQILAESIDFSSAAVRTGTAFTSSAAATNTSTGTNVSVTQSAVTVVLNAGKWTAELMQACYNLKRLGDVTISQLAQAVDKAAKAKPSVVQKLTLTNAVITAVSQEWEPADGVQRTATIVFEFDKILFEVDKKPADFTLRNTTKGAV